MISKEGETFQCVHSCLIKSLQLTMTFNKRLFQILNVFIKCTDDMQYLKVFYDRTEPL